MTDRGRVNLRFYRDVFPPNYGGVLPPNPNYTRPGAGLPLYIYI